MNRFPEIDYDRRPASYRGRSDPTELLSELLAAGLGGEEEGDSRRSVDQPSPGSGSATHGGGHTHPEAPGTFLSGEVEILLVTVAGASPNRISVRARPVPSGRSAYRIVDDHNRFYAPEPAFSDIPLSLGQLVDLLETGRPDGTLRGEVEAELRRAPDPVEAAAELLVAESSYYPDAPRHYRALARAMGEEARIPQMRYGPRGE